MRSVSVRARNRLLAVDDAKASLGDLALQMIRLGIDVLHASVVDEAELLARQEGRRIRGVLISSSSDVPELERMLEAVGPHSGIGPDAIALVGPRGDEAQLDRLRERGMLYRLWSPFEDRDLRFLAWILAWRGTDDDLRLDARVPTAIPAEVSRRGESRTMLVGDLSTSGAYLETDKPFPAGSRVVLEISLPTETIEIQAMVRWVAAPERSAGGGLSRPGFGVEFLRLPRGARGELEEFLDGECGRFVI